jgi:hypothetical protein
MPDTRIRHADLRAQHFTLDAMRGRAVPANEAADLATRLLDRMKHFPGVRTGALQDAFGLIYDELSSEAGRIERELDAEHLPHDLCPVELVELEQALKEIDR